VNGVTYTWDRNGNLLNDGMNTYVYDRANRLISVSNGQSPAVNYAYNGLNDRVRQTTNGVTTNYAIDVAGGLTQVLADGTNVYLYGNGRVAQFEGTQAGYFLGDALGSTRQLADASGSLTLNRNYQPYGEELAHEGTASSIYGYTGEITDPTGLVYLRARYYAPVQGRFLSRDTWDGDYNRPLSLNRWNYVESNPINLTDPLGRFPEWCRSRLTKWGYADCVLDYYGLEPAGWIFTAAEDVTGSAGCWRGRVHYRGGGYLEGIGKFNSVVWSGEEIVYDFATMERMKFDFSGLGFGDSFIGAGSYIYSASVSGLRSNRAINDAYRGLTHVGSLGGSASVVTEYLSAGIGVTYSKSVLDPSLQTGGPYIGLSASLDIIPIVEVGEGYVWYREKGKLKSYIKNDGSVDYGEMAVDLAKGEETPWLQGVWGIIDGEYQIFNQVSRQIIGLRELMKWAGIYEVMRQEANSASDK
jgi:RHS repeat-associated protein